MFSVQKISSIAKVMAMALVLCAGKLAAGLIDSPTMAIDPNGNMVSLWIEEVNGKNCIKAATKAGLATAWSTPVIISDQSINSKSPALAVDSTGNAVAVWISDYGVDPTHMLPRLFSTQLPFGGSWTGINVVSDPLQYVQSFELNVDSAGAIGVIWYCMTIPEGKFAIFSAQAAMGSGWGTPLQVSQ